MSRNRAVTVAGLLIALWSVPVDAQQAESVTATAQCSFDAALIRTGPDTSLSFAVEVADTPELRARGLMFRRNLPEGQGMLFIYPQAEPVSFWMRNTLIPLDLIFADDGGVIRHIHQNAKPLDETPIPGATPTDSHPERLMVLEIAGGEAARLGLQAGQILAHPALNPKTAAWPCI